MYQHLLIVMFHNKIALIIIHLETQSSQTKISVNNTLLYLNLRIVDPILVVALHASPSNAAITPKMTNANHTIVHVSIMAQDV